MDETAISNGKRDLLSAIGMHDVEKALELASLNELGGSLGEEALRFAMGYGWKDLELRAELLRGLISAGAAVGKSGEDLLMKAAKQLDSQALEIFMSAGAKTSKSLFAEIFREGYSPNRFSERKIACAAELMRLGKTPSKEDADMAFDEAKKMLEAGMLASKLEAEMSAAGKSFGRTVKKA